VSGASRISLVHIDLTFKCEDVGNCHSGCVEGSEARYKLWWRVDAGERKSHLCCVSGDKDQAPPPAPKEKGERLPQLNNLLQEKCFILLFTRMLKHIRDLFSDDKSSLIFKYESCCYYSYPPCNCSSCQSYSLASVMLHQLMYKTELFSSYPMFPVNQNLYLVRGFFLYQVSI